METALVWFRDDLRVTDNPVLTEALDRASTVLLVYVFDPRRRGPTQYGPEKLGSHRARFRLEAVAALRESLRERDGELFVRDGNPAELLPAIASTVDADAVFVQTKPATEERETERAVEAALPEHVEFERRWTHTLYHPEDLPTPPEQIADTFTPWRKTVEDTVSVREPLSAPDTVPAPTGSDAGDLEAGELPTLDALGVDDPPTDERAVLPFEGGEAAGKRRVDAYIWEEDRLREYKQTRNGLLGAGYSSKFSPWLAAGCLSPRWLYREVKRYEAERVANEDTYWLIFELLWRDFFQFQFRKHGRDFFQPGGIRGVEKEWRRDREQFRRWAAGETGVPFVDANMRELNQTGYMSNRGRQNVASVLADWLGIDWRWGAAYFEQQLVDYDVASNWGNWAYQAGVGNDSRDNHFDVLSQGEYYDAEAKYITHWLPELDGLPTEHCHRPWRMSAADQERSGVELGVTYPEPMIDVEKRSTELESE